MKMKKNVVSDYPKEQMCGNVPNGVDRAFCFRHGEGDIAFGGVDCIDKGVASNGVEMSESLSG